MLREGGRRTRTPNFFARSLVDQAGPVIRPVIRRPDDPVFGNAWKQLATNSVCSALPQRHCAAWRFRDWNCACLWHRQPAPSFAAAWPVPLVSPTSPTLTWKGRRAVFSSALRYPCRPCFRPVTSVTRSDDARFGKVDPRRDVTRNEPRSVYIGNTRQSVATRCTVHTRSGTKSRGEPD